MSACCHADSRRNSPNWARRVREIIAWIAPSAILALAPKCPACLAAYVMLWTGLGMSLSTAAYLRWALLVACAGSLLFLLVERLNRFIQYFKKGTESCNTQS